MATNCRLLYLDNMTDLTGNAEILDLTDRETGETDLRLDRTVFYPQGGGQPSDTGTIISDTAVFQVESVRLCDGAVIHKGRHLSGRLHAGQYARLSVDREKRLRHTRLHSAGELICTAVRMLGVDWPAVSANHFPGASKVVFEGSLDPKARDPMEKEMVALLNRLVAANQNITIESTDDLDEVERLCGFRPTYLDAGSTYRVVVMPDGIGRPCMGTHVGRTGDIGEIKLRHFRAKGGRIDIGYDLADEPPVTAAPT
ncbi:alanine--tRNA ligase-related protein [Azospirillum lipoferum]|uniref:Alanine--tRNA ligase n=1 Tax=Azospirillum lipoferum (strain 4B) TaxID=862719 RepID=G7Z6M7_AZOL4|nr:alanine--tRNA ligase-related protein [Azospirillum lipoferum]CBS88090.1 protein of unknown function; putative tRNA synthetase domains [Azospirillum lipoferum 4B]